MLDETETRVYKTLDNSPRVLFWSIEEFLVLVSPALLWLATGSWMLLLGGLALIPTYKWIWRRFQSRNLKSYLYWHLPGRALKRAGLLSRFPPSHLREFVL